MHSRKPGKVVGADLRLQGNTVALRTVPGLRDKKRGVCTPERLSRHWYLCLQRGGPVYDWCFLGNNLEQSSVQTAVRCAQSVYSISCYSYYIVNLHSQGKKKIDSVPSLLSHWRSLTRSTRKYVLGFTILYYFPLVLSKLLYNKYPRER